MKHKSILFVLGLALLFRLYHVSFPVAGFQGWRQADTAAMARNFYENGYNFLHPQIDWGGNTPGYVETEFPVFSYLIALCYGAFGFSDVWGRVLAILFSLIAIFYLYQLVRKFVGEKVAFWSALIYAILPLNMFYSRAVMPESLMLMSSVMAIYFFSEWIDTSKTAYLIISALTLSIATLIKPPTLYLGLPLMFLVVEKFGKGFFREWKLWLYAFGIVVPLILWYQHAHQTYLATGLSFGIWDSGTGKWGNFRPLVTLKFYNDIVFKSLAERHLTYAGFILMIVGLFIHRTTKRERLFDYWFISILVYFMIVTTGNQVHEYYQLPFALPAAVFIGKALAGFGPMMILPKEIGLKKSLRILVMASFVVLPLLSSLRYYNYMEGEKIDGPIFQLGNAVQHSTSAGDLIIAVDEADPVVLYRCNRKGWHCSVDGLTEDALEKVKRSGGRYLVGMKYYFDDDARRLILKSVLGAHSIVADTEEYFIIQL